MKIVIACGGSGGHVVPGLSLASCLRGKQKDIEIFFIVSQKVIDRKFLKNEKNVFTLPVMGMPYSFSWNFFLFLIKFFVSLAICFSWALRIRPDLFVGFGGYVSAPVILTGFLLRKPTFIHEENVIPGRANLWLSRWVSRVGVGFEETQNFFRKQTHVTYVGNPLRRDLVHLSPQKARDYFGLKEDRFTILLAGGSQGAHRLNCAIIEAFEKMAEEERFAFQMIHLAGEKDADWVETRYETLGIPARVYPFLEAMGEAYSATDLVVARGGAMTLAEIGYFRKPALLVPLPIARNHQMENAKYLASRGACVLFDEEKAMTDAFPKEILILKRDASFRQALSERLASFYLNGGAERLAQEVLASGKPNEQKIA